MMKNIEIEVVLRRHGGTRALRGFAYLKEILRLVSEDRRAIGPDLLTEAAFNCRCPRRSAYAAIDAALRNMFDLPAFDHVKPNERIYRSIAYLCGELAGTRPSEGTHSSPAKQQDHMAGR